MNTQTMHKLQIRLEPMITSVVRSPHSTLFDVGVTIIPDGRLCAGCGDEVYVPARAIYETTNHRHTYYLCERCAQEYGVPVNLNGDE